MNGNMQLFNDYSLFANFITYILVRDIVNLLKTS